MSKTDKESACIFCQIVNGVAPAHKVYEDDRMVAFMDLFPVERGHTLLIPKRHSDDIFAASAKDIAWLAGKSVALANAIRSLIKPDGIAVYQANGVAAGQTVFHYHMHLLPRYDGGSFDFHSRKQGDADDLAELALALKATLPTDF